MKTDAQPDAVNIYLKEWMAVRGVTEQRTLAEKMSRSEGAVSKKLKEPWRIDMQWLLEFAQALDVLPRDLLAPPTDAATKRRYRPNLEQLMDAASGATDKQIDALIAILNPSSPPQPKPELEPQVEQLTTTKPV